MNAAMTANTANEMNAQQGQAPFTFRPSVLAQALNPNSGQGGQADAQKGEPRVTVVVPYWKRFTEAVGQTAMAPLELTATLAKAIAAMIRALIRRVASAFGFGEQPRDDAAPVGAGAGVGADAGAGAGGQDKAHEIGPTMQMTGEASKAAEMRKAIDAELEQLFMQIKPLIDRIPLTADYQDSAGSAMLQDQLRSLADYMQKAGDAVEQKQAQAQGLAQRMADAKNAENKRQGVSVPLVEASEMMALAAKNKKDWPELSQLLAEIKVAQAQLKSTKDSFVEICIVAKSLGEDSQPYFAARRFMDKYADAQMQERIVSSTTNKFAGTSPTEPVLRENEASSSPAMTNSQSELNIDENAKVVRIRRADRFKEAGDDLNEQNVVPRDRQK